MDIIEFIVALICLALAVVMLPTLLPQLCGQPKIVAEFHHSDPTVEDRIFIVLRNEAIPANSLLRRFGVARAKANIRGRYIIKNPEGQYLEHGAQWIRLNNGEPEIVVSLEEHQWAAVDCVNRIWGTDKAYSGQGEHSENNSLNYGRYVYHFELTATGGNKVFAREFMFTSDGLEWGASVHGGRI